MILGIGIDLMDITRIERALADHPNFLNRVYAEEEAIRIADRGAQTAAGYFAAKEAVAKALGTGFRGFGMRDIAVINDELGCPEVRLTGGALERFVRIGGRSIHISVTHNKGTAAAVAVIEG